MEDKIEQHNSKFPPLCYSSCISYCKSKFTKRKDCDENIKKIDNLLDQLMLEKNIIEYKIKMLREKKRMYDDISLNTNI